MNIPTNLTLAAALGLAASAANAAVVTYTDRAAFEAALAGETTDTLGDIAQGYSTSIDRGDYTLDGNTYGCVLGGCYDNSAAGFDYPGYLWFYRGGQTFTFDTAMIGFGFDYAQPGSFSGARLRVGGERASAPSGFFGVIFDTAQIEIDMRITGGRSPYLIADNFTYAEELYSPVPLPASLPTLALGLGVLGWAARRKKRA